MTFYRVNFLNAIKNLANSFIAIKIPSIPSVPLKFYSGPSNDIP